MTTPNVDSAKDKDTKKTTTPTKDKVSGEVDIKDLLQAGAHFGHKTSRWHPKMAPYIHSKRDGIHIIDLVQTVQHLNEALDFLAKLSSEGKQILFVGTKRQSKDIVKNTAETLGMPYVSERWLGGMLTNQKTIGGRVKYLKDLEEKVQSGALVARYNKLEVQRFQEEIEQMNVLYGGIKNMASRPNAVFVFDIINDNNAVKEAIKLNIPVVALVDTNSDPTQVTYPIPCNDDAIKAIALVAEYIKNAVTSGKSRSKSAPIDKTAVVPDDKQPDTEHKNQKGEDVPKKAPALPAKTTSKKTK